MRQKIKKLLKNFTWVDWLLVGLLGAGLIYLSLFSLALWQRPKQSVEYLAAGDGSDQDSNNIEVWVDISGAVVSPGVYQLASGDRIKDALVVAGGLTGLADRDFVSTTLNLAAKVKDGDKIYIPTLVPLAPGQSKSVLGVVSGRINLNKATTAELESLTGIGAVRARAIIDSRPYAAVDDLVAKKVISQAIFEKIKDKVAVY